MFVAFLLFFLYTPLLISYFVDVSCIWLDIINDLLDVKHTYSLSNSVYNYINNEWEEEHVKSSEGGAMEEQERSREEEQGGEAGRSREGVQCRNRL